ncbi:MAG TPA: YraN family protein [Acidimicrobiia bacterium]|nr:YraN family protein [Acidimicrobiia bacterium]
MPRAPRPDPRRVLGTSGEEAVARWYERAGYEVLDRNWRVREGELDLVLRTDRTIVFCEVKTRRGVGFGLPAEAVTFAKQRRLRGLALRWLEARGTHAANLRFDVASVLVAGGAEPVIEVIEGTF